MLCQEVESATPTLIISPELCGLNPSPEIKIGHLQELLPSLSSLVSLLHQHTSPSGVDHAPWTHPLPLGGSEDYAMRHLLVPPCPILERLPSWVHVPSNIMELNFGTSHVPIPLDFGSNVWNMKSDLETTIKKIREILPHGWKEDILREKLQQHILHLSLHNFIYKETSKMNKCLRTIHSSLLSLLHVLDSHTHGDPNSHTNTPHISNLTHSLLTHTVPALWMESVRSTAPPAHWSLGEWVQDLALRWEFIDQVLTLGLKVPTYWLGAFFDCEEFLSVVTQVHTHTHTHTHTDVVK